MKVCLLNDSFPPTADGVANAVLNYATVLNEKFNNATVITPEYPDVVDNYPFTVIRYKSFDTTGKFGYRTGNPLPLSVIRKVKNDVPDVIHTHCPMSSGYIARELRLVLHRPVVFTYHTKYDIDIENSLNGKTAIKTAKRLMMNNISSFDEVWAVSEGAKKNLYSLGFDKEIRIMKNGVDFSKDAVPEEKIMKIKKEYSAETFPVLLFVGRLMWYKGLKLLIDSVSELVRNKINVFLLIVGEGKDEKEIKLYCEKAGLNGIVRFTGKITDREKLKEIYSASTLFVFPSDFDTNGLVVREAAACGLPSLLLTGSSASEGVKDGKNGFLSDGGKYAFSEKIARIIRDENLLKITGERAKDELYISWNDAVETAVREYENLCEKYKKSEHRSHILKSK